MNFGIVLFPDVEELDFVDPWEMLTMWSRYADGPQNCLTAAQTTAPVTCAKGLSVNPHHSFDNCPPLDYLLIPGGQGTRREVDNPAMRDFVARQAQNCQAVLSVCTGAFVLHAAGLLGGKRATTHWGSLDRLRALGDVEVVEQRWVQDGAVWTSAGVSAGIDLMLTFIAHVGGDEAAGKVQFGAAYYPDGKVYSDFRGHPRAPGYIRCEQQSL